MQISIPKIVSWCMVGSLIATAGHAQVGAGTAPGSTVTVSAVGSAPQTAALLAVTGLPSGTTSDDPASPGAQGKPRSGGRPSGPRGPLVITVPAAGPVAKLLTDARQCVVAGRACPFDLVITTASGTFLARGASVTQIQGPALSAGNAAVLQVTLATGSLVQQ